MTTQSIVQRGNRLEYLAASVFQGQGYLVRRAVPVKYGPTGQDATDVDVLGIKFTAPFQPHRILCDCKDRQRSKPYERIFWAKGLAAFVNAVETYVSLPKSSIEIINFARSGQVRVLTQEILQESLTKIYSGNRRSYGMANETFFEPFYRRVSPLFAKDKAAASILLDTRMRYLTDDPYVSMNICIDHMKRSVEGLAETATAKRDVFDLWRFVAADLAVLISLLLLQIASDTMGLSKTERRRYVIERLTYGDISPRKAHQIFALANQLALEAAKAANPDTSRQSLLPFDIQGIEKPSYAESVAGLVERAIGSPSLYLELPQLVDFLLFEQSLQNRPFSDEEYRLTFESHMPDERLKVARNIFAFLRDTVRLDLRWFWPNSEGNLPKREVITNRVSESAQHASEDPVAEPKSGPSGESELPVPAVKP